MNYNELIYKAVEKKEVINLLRGEQGYEVEISKFTSDIFPTDINAVLMNCFYKQQGSIDKIEEIFYKAILELLRGSACDVYIATLYFDACLFQEERGKATFILEKEDLVGKMQNAICKYKLELQEELSFANGMKKNGAWKNIENFDRYYSKKYGFSIVS